MAFRLFCHVKLFLTCKGLKTVNKTVKKAKMDFSGDNKYLTGIKLSGRSARRPTQDISQAFMVSTVKLEKAEFKYPPSVLASLPHIIRKPENLKYNYGIPANKKIIDAMIDLTYYQPDCEIHFLLPDGTEQIETFKSYTSLNSVAKFFAQELQYTDIDNLVLVRMIGAGLNMRLPTCQMPIGLFHIKDAMWTFEFKFVPKSMPMNKLTANMLNLYINQRAHEPTTIPQADLNNLIDFAAKLVDVAANPTEPNKQKLQVFLDDMNTNPKFEAINSRFAKTGEINITYYQITKDMKMRVWKGVNVPNVHDAKDCVVRRTERGFALTFGENTQYPIPRVFFESFYEFINFAMFENWESVTFRQFDFEPQPRKSGGVPRCYDDSRINFIKPEKLQEVIDSQLEFGRKLEPVDKK